MSQQLAMLSTFRFSVANFNLFNEDDAEGPDRQEQEEEEQQQQQQQEIPPKKT